MSTLTISKNRVQKLGELVVLPLEEYRRLSERAVPTYYLKGKAAEKSDKLVERGLKDYREGKTKILKSL